MQKMKSFSIKTLSKIGVEIIKHNGKKWINEKYLEIALGYKNLVNKTQYYSDELKKKKIRNTRLRRFSALQKIYCRRISSSFNN